MKWSRSLWGLLCAVPFTLAGCAGSNPAPSSPIPVGPAVNPLAGNWLITGTIPSVNPPTTAFSLAMTFDLNGNQIFAHESDAIPCGGGGAVGGAGSSLSGTLASDGSFTVQSTPLPSGSPLPTPDNIQIIGVAPTTTQASWSGKYTYTPGSSSCTTPLTGTFTAAPIQNVAGTYSGSLSLRTAQAPSNSTPITLQTALQQGANVTPPTSSSYFKSSAITGTIAVSGSSCFTHGTSANSTLGPSSSVAGNFFTLSFTMDDGSTMLMFGYMLNAESSRLSVHGLSVRGGACDGEVGSGFFELDR